MTSQAYQLPSVYRSDKQIKDYVFTGPEVRRMTAEEFADALSEVTGEWPVYAPQATRGVYARQWRMSSSPLMSLIRTAPASTARAATAGL